MTKKELKQYMKEMGIEYVFRPRLTVKKLIDIAIATMNNRIGYAILRGDSGEVERLRHLLHKFINIL